MQVNEHTSQSLHEKLPIDNDEKVIAIYKHHWFAYVASWAITCMVVIVIVAVAILLTSGGADSSVAQYRSAILAGASLFGLLVILGGMIPVYLRSKEQLVLTDEALLRVLQPSLFSSKVDQLGLQHLADVSVRQDFFGTMFGFGHVLIETPGEQETNFDFYWVSQPRDVARQITEAHENFDAALQGGRLESTLGNAPQQQAPTIDPQEFQQFLEFQQMQKMQQQNAQPQSGSTEQETSQDDNQPQQ